MIGVFTDSSVAGHEYPTEPFGPAYLDAETLAQLHILDVLYSFGDEVIPPPLAKVMRLCLKKPLQVLVV